MYSNLFFATVLALAVNIPGHMAAAADLTEYRLGGARNAMVRIQQAGDKLKCEVLFVPVKAFVAAKNRELNRGKARLYCLRALGSWASAEKSQIIEVVGLTTIGPAMEGENLYTQSYEVHVGDVNGGKKMPTNNTPTSGVPDAVDVENEVMVSVGARGLLGRAADYIDMINQIANDLIIGIHIPNSPERDLLVAEKEDEVYALYESCWREVSADTLLLGEEKKSLDSYICESRKSVVIVLKKAYDDSLTTADEVPVEKSR